MSAEVVAAAVTPLDEVLKTGLGFLSYNFFPETIATQTAPTSQTIYAAAIPLRQGQSITNVVLSVEVASSGTAPTGFFVGIATATVMQTQSGNLASGTFTQGLNNYALSAAWTVPTTGIYYVLILQNGSFSVTQPSFGRAGGRGAYGATYLSALAGTSQAALPANAGAVTLSANGIGAFFVGVS